MIETFYFFKDFLISVNATISFLTKPLLRLTWWVNLNSNTLSMFRSITLPAGADSPTNVTKFPRFHLTYPGIGSRSLVTHIEIEQDHGYLPRGASRGKMDLEMKI